MTRKRPESGITAWQFPSGSSPRAYWTPTASTVAPRLVHRKGLRKGKYIDEDRKKHPVVPVRFVRACRCGHVGDIDWHDFVHEGRELSRQLWIDERGTSGDIKDI